MKYINQIIGESEINKWKPGERVFLTAGTGAGKSYFIRSTLYDYAVKNRKRILWLTNRNILKEQVQSYLSVEQEHTIHVRNYQNVQEKISRTGYALLSIFSDYDYIVYDEAHHLFADAGFNRKTDLMLQPVRRNVQNNVIIFMTATPQQLLMYQKEYDHFYSFPSKHEHITSLYFYSKQETFDHILNQIPPGEKAIYFANRIEDAIRVAKEYGEDSRFICSSSNAANKRYISWKTVEEIEKQNSFSCKILCTTRVLDNGVDIKDESVKHIIIDITDPVELLQCIGRKRILSQNDSIKLYIKYRTSFELKGYINRLQDPLLLIDELSELGKEGFMDKYKREDWDSVIHFDMEVNQTKEVMIRYQLSAYSKMLEDGYKRYICRLLGLPYELMSNADEYFQAISLGDFMEKYIDKKMFSEDRKSFKNLFISNVFNPKRKVRKNTLGIHTINGVLQDDNLPFFIESKRETRGMDKDKYYWIVKRKSGD